MGLGGGRRCGVYGGGGGRHPEDVDGDCRSLGRSPRLEQILGIAFYLSRVSAIYATSHLIVSPYLVTSITAALRSIIYIRITHLIDSYLSRLPDRAIS